MSYKGCYTRCCTNSQKCPSIEYVSGQPRVGRLKIKICLIFIELIASLFLRMTLSNINT